MDALNHAELIEDLAYDAWCRFAPLTLRRPTRADVRLWNAAQRFGNHALALREDSEDAERACAEAGRLAFALAASIREARAQ